VANGNSHIIVLIKNFHFGLITLTLVEAGRLSTDDMQDTLEKTYATLAALKAQEETGSGTAKTQEPFAWRKSITQHAITCLECEAQFRQLWPPSAAARFGCPLLPAQIRHPRYPALSCTSHRGSAPADCGRGEAVGAEPNLCEVTEEESRRSQEIRQEKGNAEALKDGAK
jgi:hypothetical protein